MTFARKTLNERVKFSGLGLHSGVPVNVTVHPGNSGIWFRNGSERIEAIPENVSETTRCTRLGFVSTIEHMMSALAGLEITDAEVELDGPELPGMDGSSVEYVNAMASVGFENLGSQPKPELFRRVFLQEGATKVAVAKGNGHWRYVYETGERWPGTQSFEVAHAAVSYRDEIAPARTFALSEELPMIRQYGLGKGLDESSALLLGEGGYENASRFPDEPARHKLLDLIGDLYLAGIPIALLNVVSERSGHTANVKTALMLKQATTP